MEGRADNLEEQIRKIGNIHKGIARGLKDEHNKGGGVNKKW